MTIFSTNCIQRMIRKTSYNHLNSTLGDSRICSRHVFYSGNTKFCVVSGITLCTMMANYTCLFGKLLPEGFSNGIQKIVKWDFVYGRGIGRLSSKHWVILPMLTSIDSFPVVHQRKLISSLVYIQTTTFF